jgi:UDP-N-acetylglucosamine 2-epimerase (non-hydrolysing)
MKKKILIVFGTRPEAIKLAPLICLLKKKKFFNVKVCVTSQHRFMQDQVLDLFNIKPDIDLNLMRKNQNLSNLTSLILKKIGNILAQHKPDIVLVHGDTTTALSTSIGAFYESINVGHVEAGLRTKNLKFPFPEEFNRQIISKIAKFHFAPTLLNKNNLLAEGVSKTRIAITGNTIIDSLKLILKKIKKDKNYQKKISDDLNQNLNFNWRKVKFIMVTVHRRENFGDPLIQICSAIKKIAIKYPKIHIVYPVHLNPNIKETVHKELNNIKNICLIKPLQYDQFIYLLSYCYFVLTDSGGIQEEAPSLEKPTILVRNNTERPEGIGLGFVEMVGPNYKKIIKKISLLLDNKNYYKKMSNVKNPYGDGKACERIIKALTSL